MQRNKKNGTIAHFPGHHRKHHINGTHHNASINNTVTHSLTSHCVCVNTVAVTTVRPHHEEVVEIEAFMYIVFVIAFYATSIVFLLIKYARNDDEDKNLKYQYSEFVKRERFQAPQYKNKLALERTKICLENIKCNGGVSYNQTCPLITITTCSDGSISSSSCRDSVLNGAVIHAAEENEDDVDIDVTNENQDNPPYDQCDYDNALRETVPGDSCIFTNHRRGHKPCDLCEEGILRENSKLFNDDHDHHMLCDHCENNSILRAPLAVDSCRGGTSLSYDSGVDYFSGLELDEMTLYEWATYRDTNIASNDMMFIKSHTI